MPKVVFVNRFAPPDHSATAQILGDVVFALAGRGIDVHVLTSDQRYEDPGARLPTSEVIDGVTLTRVRASRFGRGTLIGRSLDYLSFYVAAFAALFAIVGRGDVVVVKTDPPLFSVLALFVVTLRRAHLVNWLQDIFPEIAMRLGVGLFRTPVGRVVQALRDRSLRAAARNVVISERMQDYVASLGVPRSRIRSIPNWSVHEPPDVIPVSACRLRRDWGLQDRFVICYSGNLGRPHDYQTILRAAEQMKDDKAVVFLFIGGGHHVGVLRSEVIARDLQDKFVFREYQRREDLGQSLSVADVHWLSLQPQLEGLIFPSKLYGIAAAGRPIIAISSPDGEIADLVTRLACGGHVPPGDGAGLARLIATYGADPDLRERLGANARAMWASHFTKARSLEAWAALLDDVQGLRTPMDRSPSAYQDGSALTAARPATGRRRA